jgi:nucleotide-binding universal stress UspA family protein
LLDAHLHEFCSIDLKYQSIMEKRQKKILVPVDFTPSSEAAIAVGLKFAKMHGAELVLLHVVEGNAPMSEFFAEGDLTEKKRAYSLMMLEKLESQHKGHGIALSHLIKDGKPYTAILKAAEEILAEMIVLGTWGSHAVESGMIGSNVNKVVRGARIPVVTVTRQPDKDDFKKILIAVDPDFGIRELRHILAVYHNAYNPMVELVSIAATEKDVDALKLYLKKQSAALHEQGIKDVMTTVRVGGIISDAILAYAKDAGHDMIWMETHGRRGISGWILGSITEEVLQYSPVPVLSLHPERESAALFYYHSNLPI